MSWVVFDIGGTRIKAAGFEGNARLFDSILPAQPNKTMPEKLHELVQLVRFWQSNGLSKPAGIGIAIPGIVDRTRGKVVSINGKHEDAKEFDFKAWTTKHFACNAIILNDAIAALIGEMEFGAARKSKNTIMLTLGTGIGTAAVVDGNILRGSGHFAGNLGGHLAMERRDAIRCNCNAFGCAEAYASTWANKTDLKALWEMAAQQNKAAGIQLTDILTTWALLIHNMILSYSPDTIVIGGGISARGKELLQELQQKMPDNIWYNAQNLDWRIAEEPDFAGLLGCVSELTKTI